MPVDRLRTGDLDHRDSDSFFFVTGRIKELIIKGGENIAPREIGEVLLRHSDVRDATAVGMPDRHYGQDILTFVVLRDGHACGEDDLRSFCEKHLGRFKTPHQILFEADPPRGLSGFGFSAVCVAGLSLFVPPAQVVPPVFILGVLASSSMLGGALPNVDWRWISWLMLGNLICIPIGVALLAVVPEIPLRQLIGSLMLVAAALRATMVILLLLVDLYALARAGIVSAGVAGGSNGWGTQAHEPRYGMGVTRKSTACGRCLNGSSRRWASPPRACWLGVRHRRNSPPRSHLLTR